MSVLLDPSKRPVVYLSRTEQFSACHRLHSKALSDEENVKVRIRACRETLR